MKKLLRKEPRIIALGLMMFGSIFLIPKKSMAQLGCFPIMPPCFEENIEGPNGPTIKCHCFDPSPNSYCVIFPCDDE